MARKQDAPVVQEADVVEEVIETPQGTVNTQTGELNEQSGTSIVPHNDSTDIVIGDVVPDFAISLDESARRIKLLQQFVREQMVEGEDYGVIPGTSGKPTLFKPGAEKLNAIFGYAPIVEVTSRLEDWDKGFVAYELKVTLINKKTREIEAEGLGSCNSKERKYARQDAPNVSNTILKMAKKRALIDATLSAVRASGLFTQDVDDLQANGALGSTPQGGNSDYKSNNRGYSNNGRSPQETGSDDIRPWNPAFTAKIGPCADEKDENGNVIKKGKTLDQMTEGELRWYYDNAVAGAEKGGQYAPGDRGKVQYIKENWPDVETYEPVQYERPSFKRR